MNVARSYTDVPDTVLTARSRPSPATHRLTGVLIAVCVPTVFWVLALKLGSNAIGITIGALALTIFGLAVACCCFVGAAVVMAGLNDL